MSRKVFEDDSYIVSTKEISEIFGMTPRNVQILTNKGAFVKVAHGKYDLRRSIKQYVDSMTEKAKPDDDELDGGKEMALWTKARKEKTELEVKIIKGELHRSKDVERILNTMLGSFKAKLLNLPSKWAPQLLMQEDISLVKDKLTKGVYEALQELKDYDPNVFYEMSTDKMFLEEEESRDDDGGVF